MVVVGLWIGFGIGVEVLVLVVELQGEVMCFICLEFFCELVFVECGYSFCCVCIGCCWECLGVGFVGVVICVFFFLLFCLQCCEFVCFSQLWFNWQLVVVVMFLWCFSLFVVVLGEYGFQVVVVWVVVVCCGQYGEFFKFYCQDDGCVICVVCDCVCEYCEYVVLLLDEVVQEVKEFLEFRLRVLKKELEDCEVFWFMEKKESKELLVSQVFVGFLWDIIEV